MEFQIQKQVYKGSWSNGYLLMDYMGNRAFRKVFRADALYQQVLREYSIAILVWKEGLSVPKPFHIGKCEKYRKYYIDFEYLELKPFNDSSKYLPHIYKILLQIGNLPTDQTLTWKSYLNDLLTAFEKYIEYIRGAPIQTILLKAKSEVMSVDPSVFVHGDFGPHNLGNHSNHIYFYDFQCSCIGPPFWDLSYLAACFSSHSPFAQSLTNSIIDSTYWYIIFIAAVRIGRKLFWRNVEDQINDRVFVLNSWVDRQKS